MLMRAAAISFKYGLMNDSVNVDFSKIQMTRKQLTERVSIQAEDIPSPSYWLGEIRASLIRCDVEPETFTFKTLATYDERTWKVFRDVELKEHELTPKERKSRG